MSIVLREYQNSAIGKLRASMRSGKRRVILQASCGAGKTLISAEIVRSAIGMGKKVLFLVNRRDLVKQTVEKYTQFGLGDQIGVIMAGFESDLNKPIQVASLQTYGRRLNLDDLSVNRWFHTADLVIYDEAHSSTAKTYRQIVELYKDTSYMVGLSATPARANGTGLGVVFQDIIQCIPTKELIDLGHLVPMVYYAPSAPDLEKIRNIGGDYDKKVLGERVDKPKLIGDIYDNWVRLAGGRKTVIFATNVKHSLHIKAHFEARGVNIEHIDAHTDDETRESVYYNFEHGNLQVLTNVGVATEGSDFPWVSAIVLARPTRVLSRYIQMAGRGARPYPEKSDCVLLDHAGCVDEHGFIEDEIEWTLSDQEVAAKKIKRNKKDPKPITCSVCTHVFNASPKCPKCGTIVENYGKKVETETADLVEIKGKQKKMTTAEKRRFYGMLQFEMRRLGKNEKWVLANYKNRTGVWPRNMDDVQPIEPDDACRNFLTWKRIQYAKKMEKQNNENSGTKRPVQEQMGFGV